MESDETNIELSDLNDTVNEFDENSTIEFDKFEEDFNVESCASCKNCPHCCYNVLSKYSLLAST